MISRLISKQVLLVGPDFNNHRGGIAAVIDMHRKQYEVFNFIPSFRSGDSNSKKAIFFIGQLFRILIFLYRNPEIKIVHIHSSKHGSLYRKWILSCMVKIFFHKKTVNHIHSGEFKFYYEKSPIISKWVIRHFIRMHNVTIALSESWKNYFETEFRLKEIHTVCNLIEVQEATLKAELNPGQPRAFLFLGNIEPQKGIFELVDLIIKNRNSLEGRCKLIIGGIGKTELMKELILTNNLSGLVEYRGWLSGDEKRKAIAEADVFILPSHYEGVPVSILEAMSFGMPVIATRVGGIPDLVKTGINGILIDPSDEDALLKAILFYLDDPENIYKHGQGSAETVQAYYPDVIMPRLEAIYSSLLSAS